VETNHFFSHHDMGPWGGAWAWSGGPDVGMGGQVRIIVGEKNNTF
jgi:hypothetical protein